MGNSGNEKNLEILLFCPGYSVIKEKCVEAPEVQGLLISDLLIKKNIYIYNLALNYDK